MQKFKKGENVMKDVILDEKTDLEKFLEKRVENNKKIFTENELQIIKDNMELINKVYLLGILDSEF